MQTEEEGADHTEDEAELAATTAAPAPIAQPLPAPGLSPALLYVAPGVVASPALLPVAAPSPAPAAQPAPAPAAVEAADAGAVAQQRIGSKVVVPSPGAFDPRWAALRAAGRAACAEPMGVA